jgi:hypothetical protein
MQSLVLESVEELSLIQVPPEQVLGFPEFNATEQFPDMRLISAPHLRSFIFHGSVLEFPLFWTPGPFFEKAERVFIRHVVDHFDLRDGIPYRRPKPHALQDQYFKVVELLGKEMRPNWKKVILTLGG